MRHSGEEVVLSCDGGVELSDELGLFSNVASPINLAPLEDCEKVHLEHRRCVDDFRKPE